MFSSELKKGSTEMLVLSLLESQPRHGYEIGKLIESRSGGRLTFALPTLYPTLLRLENRGWIKGRWVEKAGQARTLLLPSDPRRAARAGRAAGQLESLRRRRQRRSWEPTVRDWQAFVRSPLHAARTWRPSARRASSASWPRSSRTSIAKRIAGGSSEADADAHACRADPRLGSDGARRLDGGPPQRQAELRTDHRTAARAPQRSRRRDRPQPEEDC